MNRGEDLERKMDRLRREPDNSQLFGQIGILLLQKQDWNNAEKYLEKACQLNPKETEALYHLAELKYLQSRWESAIHYYQAYLELCADDWQVVKKLGDSYYQMGEYDSAAKAYQRLPKERKGTLSS